MARPKKQQRADTRSSNAWDRLPACCAAYQPHFTHSVKPGSGSSEIRNWLTGNWLDPNLSSANFEIPKCLTPSPQRRFSRDPISVAIRGLRSVHSQNNPSHTYEFSSRKSYSGHHLQRMCTSLEKKCLETSTNPLRTLRSAQVWTCCRKQRVVSGPRPKSCRLPKGNPSGRMNHVGADPQIG